MSLKPITESDALNDKSLNLYANTITANEINGGGTVDFKDIECETIICSVDGEFTGDFVATGAVCQLRGGNMPSSTSTSAGYLLTNTDGTGNLQWTDASALFPASVFPLSGTWSPTCTTASTGASIAGSSVFNYTLIGDVLTFSGDFAGDSPSTGAVFFVDIPLPLGKKPVNGSVFLAGGALDNTLTVSASNQVLGKSSVGLSVNNVGVGFSLTKGIDYTVSILNCVYVVSGQCRVVDI